MTEQGRYEKRPALSASAFLMNKSHPIESNYRPSHERGGCSTTELRWRGFKSQVENIALRLIQCKTFIIFGPLFFEPLWRQ